MTKRNDYSGMAALTICESLLLALNDHEILPESDIMGVLSDAAATHENAVETETDGAAHEAVAILITKIISGGNSVRRSWCIETCPTCRR
jgi:hypothetical protein